MRFLITYDIPDTKRRNKIAKILLDFGDRIQYSVFEADLSEDLYEKMKRRLNVQLLEDKDNLIIYRLCKDCKSKIEQLGSGQVLEDKDFYII